MSLLSKRSADDSIRIALNQDDPKAVELIWDRYARDLLALVTAMLRSRENAEDVLQTVFVKIVRDRDRLAKAHCLDTYLFRMARNETITFLRRHRRRKKDVSHWLCPVEAKHKDYDLTEQLEVALNKLPMSQRHVVVLKTYRDKTFEEIGRMLGISLNTAASRYRYGIEKLQTLLKDKIS